MKYEIETLSHKQDDQLWEEVELLKEQAIGTFKEIGRRFKELQQRYAKKGIGDFQQRCKDLGFKKSEVYTLISKYELSLEGSNVASAEKVKEKLEKASQRTVANLKRATFEERRTFFIGSVKSFKVKDNQVWEDTPKNNKLKIELEKIEASIKQLDSQRKLLLAMKREVINQMEV